MVNSEQITIFAAMKLDKINTIAFDADDTLWENEPYFRKSEKIFCNLVSDYIDEDNAMKIVYDVNIKNLQLFGYGVKAHILNMLEALSIITKNNASHSLINQVIEIGKNQINKPIVLLDNVEETLKTLSKKYRLIVVTKGDLLEQKTKFFKSNLSKYFEYIEVLEEKNEENYTTMLNKINCKTDELLMIGNSLKSDIIPILNIGGYAIHIPYHTTWEHEVVKEPVIHEKLIELKNISEVPNIVY